MAIIKTKKGEEILVDDDKVEDLNRFNWYTIRGYAYAYIPKKYRDSINIKTRDMQMHRYLTNCPEGLTVDHKNANRLDNRLENLEVVTQSENAKRVNHGLSAMESQLRRYFQSIAP